MSLLNRRYRGDVPVSYLHPALEPILGTTKGVLLFQEQVMRVAREIAGLSWAQANQIRQGMSKFRRDELLQLRRTFIEGCQRSDAGFNSAQAETLWEQVAAFAGFGFNQRHATAYAGTAYRMVYLKTHFPAQFFAARLATHGGFHHPAIYIAEARRLGIAVNPPHINHSVRHFSLVDGALWMGLDSVRDLRRTSIARIITLREKVGTFAGLSDLLARVPLHEKEVRHLIQCGALDGLADNRRMLLNAFHPSASGQQLALPLAPAAVDTETVAQRLAWELALLGIPVSVNLLETVGAPPTIKLAELPVSRGEIVAVAGFRLPG